MPAAPPDPCAICGRPTVAGRRYLVRVQVLADPKPDPDPPAETYEQLVKQLKATDAGDAQDAVYRDFEYPICPACQPRVLANPLGLPRTLTPSRN